MSLAAVAVLAGYAGLLAVSFAGGPIPPNALLPVPGVPSGRAQAPASSANAAPTSAKPAAEHSTGRPSASDHHAEAHGTTPGRAPGPNPSSEPQPTSTASSPLPPTPTGTSAAATPTAHGNPSPPGPDKHKSPAPSSTA